MTMPHLMNCCHSDDSHCLDCVKKEWDRREKEIEQYRIALADAIRRPMGVVPDSAEGLLFDRNLPEVEKISIIPSASLLELEESALAQARYMYCRNLLQDIVQAKEAHALLPSFLAEKISELLRLESHDQSNAFTDKLHYWIRSSDKYRLQLQELEKQVKEKA